MHQLDEIKLESKTSDTNRRPVSIDTLKFFIQVQINNPNKTVRL